ncbi:hypothetical protein HYPSUDRAFT_32578, partial [Hypholoma sublateritium FD-334 SS-4]
MALREWDVLDFGTARRKGGKRSRRGWRDGMDSERPERKAGADHWGSSEGSERPSARAAMAGEREIKIHTPPRVSSAVTAARTHFNSAPMFRLTRPLLSAAKRTTGIHGLSVHPNPLPELAQTYEATLVALTSIPQTSVYRQGVEALVRNKLNSLKLANGDVGAAETLLKEGHIEESLDIASDELKLAANMVEWKA